MAVKIKLKRLGRTRVPTYRIVVADARTKRDGRAIEEIGKYHPKEEPSFIEVNSERAQHWLSVGAQPTPPVMTILKITGDWQKFKGEPGAEGTLRTRETAADKKEAFAAALKDAGKDSADSGSTTPRGGGRARKSDTKASDSKASDTKAEAKTDTEAKDVKPESGRSKSKASAAKTAAGSADDSAAAAAAASTESASTEPSAAESASTEPSAAESASTEPAAAESASTESASTEPAAAEPASTDSASTDSASTEPAAAEPASTGASASSEPGSEA